MPIRTKIVCTIGPSVATIEKLVALIEAGMSVARLNFSHGSHQLHRQYIDLIKEAREKTGHAVAIMLDTKGPEVRVGVLPNPLEVESGAELTLVPFSEEVKEGQIPITPVAVVSQLKVGMSLLFDDGYISSEVIGCGPGFVKVRAKNGGTLQSGKGVNLPHTTLDIPLVTGRDIEDIIFGCSQDIDLLAASFVVGPEQLLTIKRLLIEHGQPTVSVIAKIETAQGIADLDNILEVADGVMIARGDLGVEMPLSKVPALQKMMIRKCHEVGKPSIVATQMLESMMSHSRPTRAEASDVANGIYDSASAVMLSGETAAGRYPIETVQMMREIVKESEADFDYPAFFTKAHVQPGRDVPIAVAQATVRTAIAAKAAAIFVVTSSGRTARLISRLRPPVPIFALTYDKKVYHQLAFEWGVFPILAPATQSIEEAVSVISAWALGKKYVKYGDLVVVTAGVPYGVAGTTNMLLVESIGEVAVRGHLGRGELVVGEVAIVYDPEEAMRSHLTDKIIVLTKCHASMLPLLQKSRGVVLQNHPDDKLSRDYLLRVSKELSLPVVAGVNLATLLLKEGELVTLDPRTHLVYRGDLKDLLFQSS
ncbi:MAG: pyruvate kinase [Verrucomicrobia bacterium]|nr:pyruvate kinase [Verrucomicrobiota bacterium]